VDEIDRSLFRALERNPRITCRELSKMLGISIPSVWERMISLKQSGTIGGYMAIMSQEAMDVVRVNIFGRMERGLDDKAFKALEDNDSICEVQIGGQNSLYIHCGLRHISDLDEMLRVAQDECRIDDPHPLIIGPGSILGISTSINKKDRPSIESLKDIDWQIIWSLHDNARKPVSEVAREVGVSTKTVKRRLDRLVKEELIEFYVVGDLNQSEELLFQVFIRLKSAAFRNTV
jgi:Lrp/AsnC family transcriptional regulator, leucine-responsive regulatory protein